MPVTFGAVGDIISVCLLVKDLVDALDKARGSRAEYQSLIKELWILDRSLLEIDLLARTHGGGVTPELEALCKTARRAVDRCRELVSDFSARIKKYQKSLGENETPNIIKATAMKVRWSIGEKDAINNFRAEIAATSASLQMLLATASVKLIDIHGKTMNDRITSIKQQNELNLRTQDATLISISDRLESTNRLITSGNSVTTKIADTLRLDWLRQLGTELKGYMRRIIAMNIATYHAVISIQSALPGRLERGLIEEPFILEDAIGRIAPVHLQFVTSWDAFNAVLETRFQQMQGFQKVKQKQYGLQEKATKREIEQSRPWQRAFLPGQRIEMSFLFDSQDTGSGDSEVTCPGCQTTSGNPTDAEIQCENCRMWFRRITIVHDVEPPPQVPVPSPWRLRAEFGKPGLAVMVSGPVRPGKKRVAPADLGGEDDLREFKRVRLVTRKERTKLQAFGKGRGAQKFRTFSALSTTEPEATSGTGILHRSEQTRPTAVRSVNSHEEIEGPKFVASRHPVDLTEFVEEELRKARKAGLLSSAMPATLSSQNERKEHYLGGMTTNREMFWDPKWFPQEMSGAGEGILRVNPTVEPDAPPEEYFPREESWRSWVKRLSPPPAIEVEDVVDTELVKNAPALPSVVQNYPEKVYCPDPTRVTYEALVEARAHVDLHEWHGFERRSHDDLWPLKSLSIFISSGLIIGVDEVDCTLIADAEKTYGTPFRLSCTDTVFYGASIGRWILDWTCHYWFSDDLKVRAALRLWKTIHTMEKNFFILQHEPRKLLGISPEADMNFDHFNICYRCFKLQLSSSIPAHRLPDVSAGASRAVEMYFWGSFERFFIPTPLTVNSPCEEALHILDCCATYLAAGLEALVELRKQETPTMPGSLEGKVQVRDMSGSVLEAYLARYPDTEA